MKTQSKMKMEIGHIISPIIKLWGFPSRSRAANSADSGLIWPNFQLFTDFLWLSLLLARTKKTQSKQTGHLSGHNISPLYTSYLLPWKTEFRSDLAENLMQPFPHTNDASDKLISIGPLVSEVVRFECVNRQTHRQTHGQRLILQAHPVSL